MCQAFEGERRFYLALEKDARRRGYDAFKIGKETPDDYEEFVDQWELGYWLAKNERPFE